MNYYERHIGDYLKDTAHLSLLEHGIYTRLMDVYYTRETAIPEDQVARLIGARSKEEREALDAVLVEFFERTPNGWAQARCEREIARYQEKQEKARRSANARWNAKPTHSEGNAQAHAGEDQLQSDGNANAKPTHSEGNAPRARPQAPDTSNQINTPLPPFSGGRPKRERPRSRCPGDFAPSDAGVELARRQGLDVQAEVRKFTDHHTATGSLMADWQAAWRTWVGKAVEFGRGRRDSAPRPSADREAQDMANPRPQWALDAGFPNVFEARNDGCHERTAHLFCDGKRIEVTP